MPQSGTRLQRRAPVVVRSKSKRSGLGALFSWLAPSDSTAGPGGAVRAHCLRLPAKIPNSDESSHGTNIGSGQAPEA